MTRARVAVITRTKNRGLLLRRAIESVTNQRFRDWRMIIVNDGGARDQVEPLVEEFRAVFAGRVDVIHHDQSRGMEAASNAGLRASESEYAIIHDDDDAWHPEFLRETVAFLDEHASRPRLAGVVAHSVAIEERIEGERVFKVREWPFNPGLDAVTLYRMAARNSFPPISFLFKRAALDEVGWFREDLPVLGDWDFHLRFVARYEVGVIRKPLAYYHHRVRGTASEYSNSIIGDVDKHALYDAALRNELLRTDLANGVLGLGFLVNVSRGLEDLGDHLERARASSLFGYVKDRVYNFGKRVKLIP